MKNFWVDDPCQLFSDWCYFWPMDSMSMDEKLNALSRFIIIISIIVCLIRLSVFPLWIGLFALFFVVLIWYCWKLKSKLNDK